MPTIPSQQPNLGGIQPTNGHTSNGHFLPDTNKSPPKTEKNLEAQKRQERIANAKLLGGAGVVATILGIAFKDGLKEGFLKVGHFAKAISHVISVPFSFLFPFITVQNEHTSLTGRSKSSDVDILHRMVYTAASLSFAPITFSQPLLAATRSPAQMVTALINMPHILFTLFSLTGGRALGCFTAIKKYFDPNDYRLEQKFNALYNLGNLGSAQAGVIPLSEQFNLGWGAIKDIFTGNFGSAFERFKAAPISVFLGTIFNSWTFPFDWASKLLDTTIRCAENIEQYQHALPGEEDARIVKGLKWLKEKWHKKSQDQENPFGKFLHWGREASKIEALLLPPIGMSSVVLPCFNKFLRGELFNKEAQNIGGLTGFFDKVFSISALLGHSYHTGLYGLTIRLPQAITAATFYISNLINKMRGIKLNEEGYQNQEGYVEPIEIRNKIFNRPWINKISEWAERKLNEIDKSIKEANREQAKPINPETKESTYIRSFVNVMAKEICYIPLREQYYNNVVDNEEFIDEGLENKFKKIGKKPSDQKWGEILQHKIQTDEKTIRDQAEEKLKKYLKESPQFGDKEVDYIKNQTPDWENIINETVELFKEDAKICTKKEDKNVHIINGTELPKSFWELFTKPKALWEILKARTFHIKNSILPLFIRGFVNVIDFGRKGEKFWYRNFKAQETGIREGDYMQATDREFMPVVWHAFQNAGKGMAILHGLKRLIFNGEPLPSLYEEAA